MSLLIIMSCSTPKSDQVVIAVAANMSPVMKDLLARYHEQNGLPARIVIASSGQLTAQIRQGADFDVFISADLEYPETLHSEGLTLDAPKTYAEGQLVSWTLRKELDLPLDSLLDQPFSHLAIPNPASAPYGRAAMEALKANQTFDSIEKRLVFGQSVAQTNAYLLSGAAEVVITAKSVVESGKNRGRGYWRELPAGTYTPIRQGVVSITKKGEGFSLFLLSTEAAEILRLYGYTTNTTHE